MAIVSITSGNGHRTHEAKADSIRKEWGENTIVWFTRKAHYLVYGKDADITSKILGKLLDIVFINNEMVAYLPKSQYDWRMAKAISKGYKIAIMSD